MIIIIIIITLVSLNRCSMSQSTIYFSVMLGRSYHFLGSVPIIWRSRKCFCSIKTKRHSWRFEPLISSSGSDAIPLSYRAHLNNSSNNYMYNNYCITFYSKTSMFFHTSVKFSLLRFIVLLTFLHF